jgi:DNA-binding NtrC family response regulator
MAATAPGVIRSRSRILVASADPAFRKRVMKDPAYADALSEEAVGGAHALAKLLQSPCDGVLLDRNLPDLDALEVAEQIGKQYPRIEVELLDSRVGTTDPRAMEGVAAGEELRCAEEPGEIEHSEDAGDLPGWRVAEPAISNVEALPGMIGSSRAMEQVYRLVRMVANRDTAVLVTGETGTG